VPCGGKWLHVALSAAAGHGTACGRCGTLRRWLFGWGCSQARQQHEHRDSLVGQEEMVIGKPKAAALPAQHLQVSPGGGMAWLSAQDKTPCRPCWIISTDRCMRAMQSLEGAGGQPEAAAMPPVKALHLPPAVAQLLVGSAGVRRMMASSLVCPQSLPALPACPAPHQQFIHEPLSTTVGHACTAPFLVPEAQRMQLQLWLAATRTCAAWAGDALAASAW
jgi:hypothetical protein